MMLGYLAQRRPIRPRCNIFRAAAAAAQIGADLGNRQLGTKAGGQFGGGENGVVAATVAPAEYVHAPGLDIAQAGDRDPLVRRSLHLSLETRHRRHCMADKKEQIKNIIETVSRQAFAASRIT